MENQDKVTFENKEIRASWDDAQDTRVYAVTDVLDAVTNGDGRKLWTRRKLRAKNAGTHTNDYAQTRMAGADGKMRRTDTATAAQLTQILADIPTAANRADALAQILGTAESGAKPAPRKRTRGRRGGRGKKDAAATTTAQTAEVIEPVETDADSAPTPAAETDASKDAAPRKRTRGRRGGKSTKKDGANAAKPTIDEAVTDTAADTATPAESTAAKDDSDTKAKSTRKRGGKKAVTKAVAKAAAKAVAKVAETVAERVVDRSHTDMGEHIRLAIGHRESIAVLIDADNAQLSKLKATIDELAKFGRIVVKKAYGDWKNPTLKHWEPVLTDLAIKPEQQFAYTKGKNATDIALVIDAMDLLAMGRYDTFAIICSDSDYTPLVMRLRETGAYVFGVGADQTPSPFVNACDVFINTRIFVDEKPSPARPSALPAIATPLARLEVEDVFRMMESAVELYQDTEGWTSISDAGSHIKRVYPGFRVKKYGYTKLADMVLAYPSRFATKTYIHKGATILAYQVIE